MTKTYKLRRIRVITSTEQRINTPSFSRIFNCNTNCFSQTINQVIFYILKMADPIAATVAAAITTATMPGPEPELELEPVILLANTSHIPTIQSLSTLAFTKYIPLIGRRPAPMDVDYYTLMATPGTTVHILTTTITNPSSPTKDATQVQVLGAITLSTHTHANALHVNNLLVDPNLQGRGYGKLLLSFAEEKAKEGGLGNVTLATHVQMVNNIAFYLKLGFLEVGREVVDGFARVNFRKEVF
ncbi:acyl-CoA N-acyltransferase [Aspergillus venezuelensis]